MGELGIELSAGWWRQLGNEQAAQMAEAMLLNANNHPAPPKGKRRRAADSYDIEEIVEVNGQVGVGAMGRVRSSRRRTLAPAWHQSSQRPPSECA